MTLSRVSWTNATHRAVWCEIGGRRSKSRAMLVSLPAVLLWVRLVRPSHPQRTPQRAVKPTPVLLSSGLRPQNHGNSMMLRGFLQGGAGTVRSSTHWRMGISSLIARSGTVPPTTRADAPSRRRHSVQTSPLFPTAVQPAEAPSNAKPKIEQPPLLPKVPCRYDNNFDEGTTAPSQQNSSRFQ